MHWLYTHYQRIHSGSKPVGLSCITLVPVHVLADRNHSDVLKISGGGWFWDWRKHPTPLLCTSLYALVWVICFYLFICLFLFIRNLVVVLEKLYTVNTQGVFLFPTCKIMFLKAEKAEIKLNARAAGRCPRAMVLNPCAAQEPGICWEPHSSWAVTPMYRHNTHIGGASARLGKA